MEQAIREIVSAVPVGFTFDSHYVISRLIKEHSDTYLSFAAGIGDGHVRTLPVHQAIGRLIAAIDGLAERGKSWSYNIHGNPSECTCWQRLPGSLESAR